jgi:hypothetical protein
MFRVVEDEDLRTGRFRREQHRVLRHVTRAIHLAFVVDFDLHVDLPRDRTESAEF